MLRARIYTLKLKRYNIEYSLYNRIPKIKRVDLQWHGACKSASLDSANYKNLIMLSSLFFSLFLNKDSLKTISLRRVENSTKRQSMKFYQTFSPFNWSCMLERLNVFTKVIPRCQLLRTKVRKRERIEAQFNIYNVMSKLFKLEGGFKDLNIKDLTLLLRLEKRRGTELDQYPLERFLRTLTH